MRSPGIPKFLFQHKPFKLKPMTTTKDETLVVVFHGSPMDGEIIGQILDDNGILYHLRNRLMGQIAPWQVKAGGFEPVDVEVLKKDEEQALALIREYHKQ